MGRELKYFTLKNQKQKTVIQEMGDKKSYNIENEQQMTEVNPSLSVITLNVNGLNSPIKDRD